MNKVTSFFRQFNQYKNKHLSLEDRFVNKENKRMSKESHFYELINKENMSFLDFLKAVCLSPLSNPFTLENNMLSTIDRFTDESISNEEIDGWINYTLENNKMDLLSITYSDRNKINFILFNKTISAEKLSSKYPKIAKFFPEIQKLDTRKGKCHFASIVLAKGLEDSAKVVTGSVYTTTPSFRFLHSWVEEEIDDKTYCYDYTFNISMLKEDYYRLLHAKVFEKISWQQIEQDEKSIIKLVATNPIIYSKLYLTSRDEALKVADTLPEIDTSNLQLIP
jgi:hypothetical protein